MIATGCRSIAISTRHDGPGGSQIDSSRPQASPPRPLAIELRLRRAVRATEQRREPSGVGTPDGNGAVRLIGGHIGGQLVLRGATITNVSGPALYADGLVVDSDAFLDGGFTATGSGADSAVRLTGVVIKGS